MENELVVKAVLPVAQASGFELKDPFPAWPRKGLPLLPGHQHLIRIGEILCNPVVSLHIRLLLLVAVNIIVFQPCF